MEDLVMENKDETQQKWLKTLQGLAQGIQCFGGEIPFFFWSGWIIKKIGHVNCMALSLGTTAIRMYLYTVISNPTWIILIELLNGVSYALGLAVKMSYSKIMSPPDTLNSVIGALGFFDLIGVFYCIIFKIISFPVIRIINVCYNKYIKRSIIVNGNYFSRLPKIVG
jgi:hypothetical protein